MVDKYNITYYEDFLTNLKKEYGSSNEICDKFNIGIKHYIDEINENAGHFSVSDWQNIKNVIFSNTEDAKHLAIYLINDSLCPLQIVREIADKTTDSDILTACLSVEYDVKRISYLVNSINPQKLNDIARKAESNNKLPKFTTAVLNYLATECGDKISDIYLMFCRNIGIIESLEHKNNGFTEKQATYILKNPNIPYVTKKRIYDEYGCDFTMINKSMPEAICDDIFISACETVFEANDVDSNTRNEISKIIYNLQNKKLVSCNAQMKFIQWYKNNKTNINDYVYMTYNDIAVTTKSPLICGLIDNPLKYRNPIMDSNSLSTVLLEEMMCLPFDPTENTYRERVKLISDKILYQNNIKTDSLESLYNFIKTQKNAYKEKYLYQIAVSVVSNPLVNKEWRDKYAHLYKDVDIVQVMNVINTDLQNNNFDKEEIFYILECVLRKNSYAEKHPENRTPDVYITQNKYETLRKIFNQYSAISPDISSLLKKGMQIIRFERNSLVMYEEHKSMFTPASQYKLGSYNRNIKTLDVLKLDEYNDEQLREKYREFDLPNLKVVKNCIYSAVSYQDNKCYLYAWLDKYVRQYNIVNEILKEKMIEAQRENEEKIKETTNVFER